MLHHPILMSSSVYRYFFFYGLHCFNVLPNNFEKVPLLLQALKKVLLLLQAYSKAVPAYGNTFTQFYLLPTVLCSCVCVNSDENTWKNPLCAICIDNNMIVARWYAEPLYLLCYVKESFSFKTRMPGTVKCRPTVAY